MAWQRLKAVGAFEAAYRGGLKRNTHADHDVGRPTASYHFWLKVARETWARNHTPDEYFYIGLTSPRAELFFTSAMRAHQAQDFTDRISFYISPTWAAIKQLIPAN